MSRAFATVRPLDQRVIDGLYVEAIVLADEARAFFDHHGEAYRATLDKHLCVDFACESLKVTTRIMHAIAWLLAQRAIFAGELAESARLEERYRLGEATATEPAQCAAFTAEMGMLILASQDLYDRIIRVERTLLDRASWGEAPARSPARDLLSRLEGSL